MSVEQSYPLEPISIGEDTYCVISKGHHDVHEFMNAVRENWSWPLGMPKRIWMKTVPAPKNSSYVCWYEPVPEGTRGAWPCTYVTEAWGDRSYEALATHQPTKEAEKP